MSIRRAVLAALLAIAATACRKDRPAAPPPVTPLGFSATDALWQLAPPGVVVGAVVGDGTLETVFEAQAVVLDALAGMPEGAATIAELKQKLAATGFDATDRAALTAAGIDLAKGMAAFSVQGGADVFILPVGDRGKFVKLMGGSSTGEVDTVDRRICRTVAGRYACAHDPALLDQLGKGAAAIELPSWAAALRGHAELFVGPGFIDGGGDITTGSKGLRVGVRLERGGLTVRAHLTGALNPALAKAKNPAPSPLIAEAAARGPAGAFILDAVAATAAYLAPQAGQIPAEIKVGDVALRDLLASVRGDLVATAAHGLPLRGHLALGLHREEPARAFLAACTLPMPLPGLTLEKAGDRCKATMAGVPGGPSLSAELWVEGGALRARLADADPPTPGRLVPTAIGKELMGEFQFAMWGFGSLVGAPGLDQLTAMPIPSPGLAIWAAAHFSEMGLGARLADDGLHGMLYLRTTFSYPEPLRGEVEKLLVAIARHEAGALESLRALAAKHPGSPLAAELDAGAGGLIPVATSGMLAAIAIPAFMKYMGKSKASEARAMVQRLYQGARAHAAERGALPTPSAGPVPPAGACCASGEKCAPDAVQWQDEPWRSLGFSMDDPHYYSYQYEVTPDGKTFTVRAIGDLDCDGLYSNISLGGQLGALDLEPPWVIIDELE